MSPADLAEKGKKEPVGISEQGFNDHRRNSTRKQEFEAPIPPDLTTNMEQQPLQEKNVPINSSNRRKVENEKSVDNGSKAQTPRKAAANKGVDNDVDNMQFAEAESTTAVKKGKKKSADQQSVNSQKNQRQNSSQATAVANTSSQVKAQEKEGSKFVEE